MNSVKFFPDIDALAKAIALRFRDEAIRAAKENRLYSIVLTGGNTAAKVYRLFDETGYGDEIPWESVHLFWTDERCVPPQSNESNFGTSLRAFLHSVRIPDKNIHRIRGEDDPANEANRYACEILEHMALKKASKYCFDWVLMGLGQDGHTASLFPGQQFLLDTPEFCGVAKQPETGKNRITLTRSAFQQAGCITYHVIGSQKAEIVSDLVTASGKSKEYPASNISGEWYLDQAAASKLNGSCQD